VFEHYVCFHSNVFGYVKNKTIPLKVRRRPGRPYFLLTSQAGPALLHDDTHVAHGTCDQQRSAAAAAAAVVALATAQQTLCRASRQRFRLMHAAWSYPVEPTPPQEVTAVRKRKNLGIPNSIEIHWGERRRESFTSFLSREDAFRLIVAAWHQSAPDKAAAQMFSTGNRKREQSSQLLFAAREAGRLLLLLSYGRGSSAGAADRRTGIPCGNLVPDIVRQKLWQPYVQLCFTELLFKLVYPLLCSGEDRAVSDVGGVCLSACRGARQRRRRGRRAGGGPGQLPNQVGKPADAANGVGAAPRERARSGTGRLRHRRGASIFDSIEVQPSPQHYEFSARLV